MSKQIGKLSFSENGYNRFISMPKEKQLEKVYNSLNPKDYREAERLLKNVPNSDDINNIKTVTDGNITSGNEQEAARNNGAGTGGGNVKDNTPGRRKPSKGD